MVMGRFKGAVSDVAETIRRVFQDPDCRMVSMPFGVPASAKMAPLMVNSTRVSHEFLPGLVHGDLIFPARTQDGDIRFKAVLCSENAWTTWMAGAKVYEMPVFAAGLCGRMAIPPLPRFASILRLDMRPFTLTQRSIRAPFLPPPVRTLAPKVGPPGVRRDLEGILRLPIAISGEDLQKLPKALSMRFTFQLVKATGENIRNLVVLGLYPVPVKGVTSLRHDTRSGRILVTLDREAVGAVRGRFILARRRDNLDYVSCFVEE